MPPTQTVLSQPRKCSLALLEVHCNRCLTDLQVRCPLHFVLTQPSNCPIPLLNPTKDSTSHEFTAVLPFTVYPHSALQLLSLTFDIHHNSTSDRVATPLALQVVLSHPSSYSPALLESITTACLEAHLLEKAGSLYEQQQRWADARTVYRQ